MARRGVSQGDVRLGEDVGGDGYDDEYTVKNYPNISPNQYQQPVTIPIDTNGYPWDICLDQSKMISFKPTNIPAGPHQYPLCVNSDAGFRLY